MQYSARFRKFSHVHLYVKENLCTEDSIRILHIFYHAVRMYGAVPFCTMLSIFFVFFLLNFVIKNRTAFVAVPHWQCYGGLLSRAMPSIYAFFFLAPPRFFVVFFFSASTVSAFLLAVRWSSSEFFWTDITLKMSRQVRGGWA